MTARATARVGAVRIDGVWLTLDEITRLVRLGRAAEARTQPVLPTVVRPASGPLATLEDARRMRASVPARPVRR